MYEKEVQRVMKVSGAKGRKNGENALGESRECAFSHRDSVQTSWPGSAIRVRTKSLPVLLRR